MITTVPRRMYPNSIWNMIDTRDRDMKKWISVFMCVSLLLGACPAADAYAEDGWPDQVSIEAEGGIVMDASTGAILYGKNIHTPYYPASITKILTALIVIENCSLNETVTFSHSAVYDVEAGSTSAGLDVGDTLSVRDCLYAMLLKSANEVANALAEHVAGSNAAFAEMMNEKAASLGCVDSHFANPSGLNDEQHYTSAYDMALIGQEALKNETFMKIDSTLYYDLPVTKRNPEGARIYPGHRMIKKNMAEYYEGCLGGKTGYTSLAGNTLVTFARRNGMTLVAVILNGRQSHYRDTKALLDFGFQNFKTIAASEFDSDFLSVENDLTIGGFPTSEVSGLQPDPAGAITLPNSADPSSVTSRLSYDLTDKAPDGAIARVDYAWGGRAIGSAYLIMDTPDTESVPIPSDVMKEITDITLRADSSAAESSSAQPEKAPFYVPPVLWTVLGVLAVSAALIFLFLILKARQEKKEMEARMRRRQRRMARMGSGFSPADFDLRMEEKRRSYRATRRPRPRRRPSSRRRYR